MELFRWGSEEQERKSRAGRSAETLRTAKEMAVGAKSWHVGFRRVSSGRGYEFESDSDGDGEEHDQGGDCQQSDKPITDTKRPRSETQQDSEQERSAMHAKEKLTGIR